MSQLKQSIYSMSSLDATIPFLSAFLPIAATLGSMQQVTLSPVIR